MSLLAEASGAATYAQLATAIVLIIAATLAALRAVGLLKFGNASDYIAELQLAEKRGERLVHENERLTEENARLHQTRSLEPLISMLEPLASMMLASSEMQQATLEKLASFNGTLRHIQEGFEENALGLRTATDGLGVVVALLQTLHGLPVVQHERGRNLMDDEGDDG